MDIKEISAYGFSAKINLTRGACCISLRCGTLEILREPNYSQLDNPYLYGMPLLFPVNRIDEGSFVFEDRLYRFPVNEPETGCHLHGTLHETPFTLVEQGDGYLRAGYAAAAGEYHGFQHSFEIEVIYELCEWGLSHTVKVKNKSQNNMPCLLGYHTTFNARPFGPAESTWVKVDVEREYERNMKNYLPTGICPEPDDVTRALTAGEFEPCSRPISRHYKAPRAGVISIRSARGEIMYENSDNLPFRLVYNGPANGYICLEPMTSLANSPRSPFTREDAGFNYIRPYSEQVFESRIKINIFNRKDHGI